MRALLLVLPLAFLSACASSGVDEPFHDVFCNAEGQDLKMVGITPDGSRQEYVMAGGTFGTTFRKFVKVEAYSMDGKLLGSYARTIPGGKIYTAPMWVLATGEGVFPIPDRYKLTWKQNVAEIVAASEGRGEVKIRETNL